jgi:hypothetical protein
MSLFNNTNKDLKFEEYITSEIDKNENQEGKVFNKAVDRFIETRELANYEIPESNEVKKIKVKCTLLRRAKR